MKDSLTGLALVKFNNANAMLVTGQYANAGVEFKNAYVAQNDARLHWNVAYCEKQIGHFIRAQEWAIKYRDEDARFMTAADIVEVENFIKSMEQQIALVEFVVEPAGAKIVLDGIDVGISPLPNLTRVDMGNRQVRFEKAGFDTFTDHREISGQTRTKWFATLKKVRHVGRLIIEADNRDVIYIDGKRAGLGRVEQEVSTGGHIVRVTAPGKLPWSSDVSVKDNETRRIKIKLPNEPDFSKWVWAAGGVAIFAGAIIAGAVLYAPSLARANPTLDNRYQFP